MNGTPSAGLFAMGVWGQLEKEWHMIRCKDCKYYKAINAQKGTCFGVEINANQDPENDDRCRGRYFERKIEFDKLLSK